MCRSIKTLRSGTTVAHSEEIEAAALQFVRKISGFRKPTARHEEAFNAAVHEITHISEHLLETLALTMSSQGSSRASANGHGA